MLPPIGQNWNCLWSLPLIKSDLMEHFPRTSSGYQNCNWIVTAVITGASTISFWYLWHNYTTGLWVWDAEEMRLWERRIGNQCQPPKQDTGREKWANCPGGVRDQREKTTAPAGREPPLHCARVWQEPRDNRAHSQRHRPASLNSGLPALFPVSSQSTRPKTTCAGLTSEDSPVSELALIAVPCWSL